MPTSQASDVRQLTVRFTQGEALVGDKRVAGREEGVSPSLSLNHQVSGTKSFSVAPALSRQATMVLPARDQVSELK